MSSQLAPFAFVERLLEAEEPIWYRWDKDIPALLRELLALAHREAFLGTERARLPGIAYATPESACVLAFGPAGRIYSEGLETSSYAMFAWGRRLNPDERNLLVAEPLESARLLAWCDSCPSADLPSLFDWRETWRSVLKSGCFPPHPEDEFDQRCGTVRCGLELCAHLEAAASSFRQGGEVETSFARASIPRAFA